MRGETTTDWETSTFVSSMGKWAFDINRHICSLSLSLSLSNEAKEILVRQGASLLRHLAVYCTAYHPSASQFIPPGHHSLGDTAPLTAFFAICYLISGLMETGMWMMEECHYTYVTRVRGWRPSLIQRGNSLPLTWFRHFWWAATLATYCPGRMTAHPKSKSPRIITLYRERLKSMHQVA